MKQIMRSFIQHVIHYVLCRPLKAGEKINNLHAGNHKKETRNLADFKVF